MGQYYIPAIFNKSANLKNAYDEGETNITDKPVAALLSHHFKYRMTGYDGRKFTCSIGLKLMEHSYIGNPLCRAMEHLLSHEYAGCPVVWGGDYADERYLNDEGKNTNSYCLCSDELLENTYKSLPKKQGYNRYHKYLINHDTHEYVKLPKCKKDDWQIHPLPLLTADGCGRGGGDFIGNDERIGMWCGHHLSVANELPTDGFYTEIDGVFHEDD